MCVSKRVGHANWMFGTDEMRIVDDGDVREVSGNAPHKKYDSCTSVCICDTLFEGLKRVQGVDGCLHVATDRCFLLCAYFCVHSWDDFLHLQALSCRLDRMRSSLSFCFRWRTLTSQCVSDVCDAL